MDFKDLQTIKARHNKKDYQKEFYFDNAKTSRYWLEKLF